MRTAGAWAARAASERRWPVHADAMVACRTRGWTQPRACSADGFQGFSEGQCRGMAWQEAALLLSALLLLFLLRHAATPARRSS